MAHRGRREVVVRVDLLALGVPDRRELGPYGGGLTTPDSKPTTSQGCDFDEVTDLARYVGANSVAMSTDAFDMAVVHRVFRTELHNAPGLVRDVKAGDTKRSAIVGDHLNFIVAALHNHHAAEDELIWPKLHARAPAQAAEIARMQGEHRGIAESVARVQDIVASWAASADPRLAEQLIPALENLSAVADEHLADEELNVVPLINEHITSGEWQETAARAAEFLSRKNLRLGLVLGGYVLDAASPSEGRRLLASVPLPKRVLLVLLARPAFANYRRKIYG